jgi:hypothetical protein
LSIQYRDIEFTPVQAGSVFLGTEKGGWMYGSQRPRHEVQCPEFYVMKSVLSQSQLQTLLELDETEIILSGDRLIQICTELSERFESFEYGLDSSKSWEVRCPSEGEWRHAHEQVQLELEAKKMDGRPRSFTGIGPMANHRTAIETHPNQKGITALSSAPMDRELSGMVARLVITPVREGEAIRVPLNADFSSNIRGEIFWTFLLGVIPSFAIPIARGMGGYVTSGWANLLFGGLCAGFVTGAFWRPRRPTVSFDEVKNSVPSGRRD